MINCKIAAGAYSRGRKRENGIKEAACNKMEGSDVIKRASAKLDRPSAGSACGRRHGRTLLINQCNEELSALFTPPNASAVACVICSSGQI